MKHAIPLGLAALSMACGTAHADRIATTTPQALEKSGYSVELVDSYGSSMPTYRHKGRFYVPGQSNDRYTIRVHNPTSKRVEAVISVDGLDAIDGKDADFQSKRGYIIAPHQSLDIDGFRVSTEAVAAFRFSTVAKSYAGRLGKSRNVGVIGVAIFPEKSRPQVVELAEKRKRPVRRNRRPYNPGAPSPSVDSVSAEDSASTLGGSSQRSSVSKSSSARDESARDDRPGLGTAFGEERHSAVRYTKFTRKSPNKPALVLALRYNNHQGLRALGLRFPPKHKPLKDEVVRRENADPFPGSRFAQPPPR